MKRIFILAFATAVLAAGAARAGADVRFGADVPIGDDGRLFVSISSRYFDRDPVVVEDWHRRYYPDPDDLAVALFIGRHCSQDPEFIFGLRRQGLGWFEISNRCRVPVDAYFVTLKRDPGPPYGNAYGHWKKHRRDRNHVMVLGDDDIRRLVGARMIHEYYGVPYEKAMKWRARDRDVQSTMAREYRQRHDEKRKDGKHNDDKRRGDGDRGGRDRGGKDHGKGNDHKGGKDKRD